VLGFFWMTVNIPGGGFLASLYDHSIPAARRIQRFCSETVTRMRSRSENDRAMMVRRRYVEIDSRHRGVRRRRAWRPVHMIRQTQSPRHAQQTLGTGASGPQPSLSLDAQGRPQHHRDRSCRGCEPGEAGNCPNCAQERENGLAASRHKTGQTKRVRIKVYGPTSRMIGIRNLIGGPPSGYPAGAISRSRPGQTTPAVFWGA